MPDMFLLCVFGGRDFDDYALMESRLDDLLRNKHPHVKLILGACRGADKLAERYAAARGYQFDLYPADWEKYGRGAGFRRNREMAQVCHAGAGFHDGVSRGTAMMREILEQLDKPVRMTYYPVKPKPVKMRAPAPITYPDQITVGKPRQRKSKPIVIDGETLIPETKPKAAKKPRKGAIVYKHDYKKIYQEAYELYFKREYPNAYKDGHFTMHKIQPVDTANGLCAYIINHLSWTGNYGNRINVMGRQVGGITKTQSGATFDDRKFIKATTRRGTEDIDAIIFKRPVKIEIKIGSDTQSLSQQKHEARVKKAGGDYKIIRTVDDYLDYFFTLRDSVNLLGER